ncbi:MAG: HdeD family acid-resistance protein [Candidatus Eremiobacteraeota bacterium]|nr:HdeD family acid-resistance protein [Candidatus Eremiobacteraeota bacterium]
MVQLLARNWWAFLIRGLAGVVFGVLAFLWPGETLLVLAILLGAYALVDGVFALVAAFSHAGASHRGWLIFEGALGVILGVLIWLYPLYSAALLVYLIAFWAIATGVVEITAGIRFRNVIADEILYILAGIASIVFGILVLRNPAAGAIAVVWLIASYAIVFGLLQVALSFRLKALASPPT